MKTLKTFLTEARTPRHYWLVFDIPTSGRWRGVTAEEVFAQLRGHKLTGVQGISSDSRIVRQFFHSMRNALLVMDARDVEARNKLRSINYHDVNSLLANGMADLYRIWSKDKTRKSDLAQVLGTMFDYGQRVVRNGLSDAGVTGQNVGRILTDLNYSKPINNVTQLKAAILFALTNAEKVFKDSWWSYKWSFDNWRKFFEGSDANRFIEAVAPEIARIYGDEGEVQLVDGVLHIPPRYTKLIVLDRVDEHDRIQKQHAMFRSKFDDEWVESYKAWMAGVKSLEGLYDVQYINERKYGENRVPLFGKRQKKK